MRLRVSGVTFTARALTLAAGALAAGLGVPPELAALAGGAPSLLDAVELGSPDRARWSAPPPVRLAQYLAFDAAILGVLSDATFIVTYPTGRIPNVWRLAPLWRATERLQEHLSQLLEASAAVGLLGGEQVRANARSAGDAIAIALSDLGRCRPGSNAAREAARKAVADVSRELEGYRAAVAVEVGREAQ